MPLPVYQSYQIDALAGKARVEANAQGGKFAELARQYREGMLLWGLSSELAKARRAYREDFLREA